MESESFRGSYESELLRSSNRPVWGITVKGVNGLVVEWFEVTAHTSKDAVSIAHATIARRMPAPPHKYRLVAERLC